MVLVKDCALTKTLWSLILTKNSYSLVISVTTLSLNPSEIWVSYSTQIASYSSHQLYSKSCSTCTNLTYLQTLRPGYFHNRGQCNSWKPNRSLHLLTHVKKQQRVKNSLACIVTQVQQHHRNTLRSEKAPGQVLHSFQNWLLQSSPLPSNSRPLFGIFSKSEIFDMSLL